MKFGIRFRIVGLTLIVFLTVQNCLSQITPPNNIKHSFPDYYKDNRDEILDCILSQRDEETINEEELEELEESLERYYESPIDLNGRHLREKLEDLKFLSFSQIESLCQYVYEYGPIRTTNELSLIEGLSRQDIKNLLPYVQIGSDRDEKETFGWRRALREGDYEIVSKYRRSLETRLGYTDSAYKKGGRAYLGSPEYIGVQMRYHYKDRIYVGVAMEKDPGEQFWNDSIRGFDNYNFYVQLEHPIRYVSTLCLGDYNVQWGRGLIVNTLYNTGIQGMLYSGASRSSRIRRFTGQSERPRFRGIGTELSFGQHIMWSIIASHYHGDASISKQGTFTHLLSDGYHRTLSELHHKDSVIANSLGSRLQAQWRNAEIGVNVLHVHFSKMCVPTNQDYAKYQFGGKDALAAGVDYRLRKSRLSFSGEVVSDKNAHMAQLHVIEYAMTSYLSMLASYRDYSKRYDQPFANAIEEGGRVNGERGANIGWSYVPSARFKLVQYVDYYSFPYLKYRISKPTTGWDVYTRCDYSLSDDWSFFAKFRYRDRDADIGSKSEKNLQTLPYRRHAVTLSGTRSWGDGVLSLTERIDWCRAHHVDTLSATYGYQLTTTIRINPRRVPLRLNLRFAYFKTDSYDNVIYTYEDDVLYSYSSNQANGEGVRLYATLRYQPWQCVTLYAKIGQTRRFDQDYIGSNYDRIDKNHRTDVSVLARLHF